MDSNFIERMCLSSGEIIDELLAKYPLPGFGPLAWIEAADASAVLAGETMLDVLSRWMHLSKEGRLKVQSDVNGLSISEG
ncbi:hypothetical protein ACB040_13730 [Aeromonas sp. S11(2024)]|uniref:hypothetical protein n=1 Tax=Aeromonas TaxID=642 RepID=UPI003529A28F